MGQIIEGVTKEMEVASAKKFELWDTVLEEGWFESEDPKKQKEIYQLLLDPTIYAYAFFRDPRNLKKRFKCYPYQDIILNDNHRRVYFDAANQIGKSIGLCLKAITFALLNPGRTVLMTSKTLPQSKDLLRQIKQFLQNSRLDYKYDIGDSETKTEIYFRHFEEEEIYDEKLDKTFIQTKELQQSRIICTPATEAALGYAVDLLLPDELPFYENGEYFFKQILQPRTYTTKGQIMVFGNPNGQQGIGWELWNDPEYHRYKFDFLDCPTNTQEEFDALCKGLTREQIDSTLLAVFTSPKGGFLTLDERRRMQEERS